MRRPRSLSVAAGAIAAFSLVGVSLLTPTAAVADDVGIEILSGRADSVSGGDALISVSGATDATRVTAAGVDVTDAFAPRGSDLVGLVEGLPLGASEVVASTPGAPAAVLDVVNHPISGPVFSGPQHPMYCTASGSPWNFGELDENCHIEGALVTYRYRTTAGTFADYPTDGTVPADLATTTVEGVEVPYTVRVERGTINRSVYEIALLHEPGTPEPSPWQATPGWSGKLAYTFGGACGVGYWQGTSTGGVENDLFLRNGYAVASSTLNVYAQNCNDVTSAETAMMVKEHLIESYGPVRFTMGSGGSAGTMQQLLLANNYPGILDGVLGEIGYPDERTTTMTGHDCRGLQNFWASPAGAGWSDAEKTAVTGHAVPFTCVGFTFFDGVDDPNRGCAAAIPVEDRWSPTNPDGLRCTISDMVKNVYGVDEEGRGLRPIPDNVGVQYGLGALENGEISLEQFLTLNESIGGMDIDGNRTSERSEASVEAIERAFETGRVNMMTGGLEYIPVLEIRPYSDLRGDFHERYRDAIMHERMVAAHGDSATFVSWTSPEDRAISTAMRAEAFAYMDAWLEGIEQAGGPGDRSRTIAARPAGLTDGCFDTAGDFIEEELNYSDPTTACNTLFPYHSEPRAVAGDELMRDVLKCQLVTPVRADYPVMTDAEWQRLQDAFADGVCDFAQPSQGYAELQGTWLDFGATEPASLTTPVVEGEARVGSTLRAVASSAGAQLSFQWLVNGVPAVDATGPEFALDADAEGARITVAVTAEADGFVTRTAVSSATVPVAGAADPSPSPTPPDTVDSDEPWAVVQLATDRVKRGDVLSAQVSGLTPGQQIGATLNSDPIVVTGIPAASADGTTSFRVAVPYDFALGVHTLVVTAAGESPISVQVTVLPASALAVTGTDGAQLMALIGLVLALGGGAALLGRRRVIAARRRDHRTENGTAVVLRGGEGE